jgi:signal transduction histidine kinase
MHDDQSTPEREQTDASLRVERQKADDAIGDKPASIEEIADAVIEKARARADVLLAATRSQMDHRSAVRGAIAESPQVVERERRLEDQALRREREQADETLLEERIHNAAVLATEREATDKDLSLERARSDRAVATRDEFLGVVSHDLRNMLGAVIGFARLIEDGQARDTPANVVAGYAGRIQRAGARMNRLVGDLEDLASIHAGRLAVVREVADLGPVVAEAVDTLHAHAAANGLMLAADIEDGLPAVAFDTARVLQVLINLLSNAIKFTPRGGSVGVRVERAADDVRVVVSDTGIGIPPDKVDAVFDRFLQVKEDRRGVGLGLYISKCIVEGHGGAISAESTVGVGSKFSFTLPVHVPA